MLVYLKLWIYISLLTTLRDAVLAAETTFGDVMGNMVKVFENFGTVQEIFKAAADPKCIFTCPQGGKPRKNRNHTPSSDGCGSFGINLGKDFLPLADMTKCCDVHDICYDTCNNDKESCDMEFRSCLLTFCEQKVAALGAEVIKTCKKAANFLVAGSSTLGCKAYKDAQTKACYCSEDSRYDSRKKKYTRGDEL